MGGMIDRLGEIKDWGEEVTHLESERIPVVFNFRPKVYMRVKEEHIALWETVFKEELGLRPALEDDDGPYGPQPTISGSNDGWDDCDA